MNSCLCHLHSYVLVCSQTLLHFFCICICFGGPIRCLKIAGVSLVGHLWYFMGLSCKENVSMENAARPA